MHYGENLSLLRSVLHSFVHLFLPFFYNLDEQQSKFCSCSCVCCAYFLTCIKCSHDFLSQIVDERSACGDVDHYLKCIILNGEQLFKNRKLLLKVCVSTESSVTHSGFKSSVFCLKGKIT